MKKKILCFPFRFPPPPILCLLLSLVLFPAALLKAQVLTLPVNLAYLSQRADVIVRGRVVDVRCENHPEFSGILTVRVTLEVEDMLRGPSGQTYTFSELLLGIGAGKLKQGYATGQRLMLFLPSPSRYGLSSPVGIEQGRFHVTRTAKGEETVTNETGNAGLFRDVRNTTFMAGIRLSSKDVRLAETKQGPVPLAEFSALVKTLTALPRIQ
ncbi:MAG: hypothetical protein JW793_13415 [Acidobacteria bacterium]|nr:hypothetical protein [Acidobacteriota bacterium]